LPGQQYREACNIPSSSHTIPSPDLPSLNSVCTVCEWQP
jgi:hypothetical protein